MVLVVGPDAVEVFTGIELAHVVEKHGHGAKPVVVKVFFRVVLHALQSVLKNIFRIAFLVAHLGKAREGGHFGNKALQNVRIKQQTHKAVHGFGSNLAPFVHDVCGGHVIEHAA